MVLSGKKMAFLEHVDYLMGHFSTLINSINYFKIDC